MTEDVATERAAHRWKHVRDLPGGGQGMIDVVIDVTREFEGEYVRKRLRNLERIERFAREIAVMRTLDHPNIVHLIDADLSASRPFIVVEYCRGGTLTHDPAAPPLTLLRTFLKICEAVKYAHDGGVIHRDLKPENIFLDDGHTEPKVGDFGICFIDEDDRLTTVNEVAGPRFFACPEARDGRAERVNASCDIYSLGKILHFMFTGRRFDRENFSDEQNNLTRRADGYFLQHVNDVLGRMITANEADRFSQMSDVIQAVRRAVHLIEGHYNPLTREQGCRYCGDGVYQPVRRDQFHYFGLRSQSAALHALQCATCGNVQVFFLHDQVTRRTWMDDLNLVSR